MSLNRTFITLFVSTILVTGASAQQLDVMEPGIRPSAASAAGPAATRASTDVPWGIGYQAVARNANGEILGNQPMGLRVSVLSGSATGSVLYAETHAVTSDAFGVVSFVIGQGTPAGAAFRDIDWNGEAVFVKLEADFAGGTTYTDLGATRVWSVPFALAAGNAFDPRIPRVLNTADGDSGIVTRISGDKFALSAYNYIKTNGANTNGVMYNELIPSGTNAGFNYGTYNFVQAGDRGGQGTTSYASYNVTRGGSKLKYGVLGLTIDDGTGEIVPFGDPREAQGNFGSANYGVLGSARNNANLNIGVFGITSGSGVGGARGNVGVEGQSFTNSAALNMGMVASAWNSSVRNIGVIANANRATAGRNIGMEINVGNATLENTGLIVNAGANTAAILNGNLTVNGNITHSGSITQSSDRSLKDGIAPLESTLSKLLSMNVVSYQYRQDTGLNLPTGTHYGVVAQELEPLFPELVRDNVARIPSADASGAGPSSAAATLEYKSVNYTEMIPLLIKAMQEQQAQIEALKAEIERLKGE